MKNIIQLKEITCIAEEKVIISNISFKIRRGEAVMISGKSGSGKTTLGKILAGNIQASQGFIEIEEGLKRIFVPQQHTFRLLSHSKSYYQQRYEISDNSDFPTVKEYLSLTGFPEAESSEITGNLGIRQLMAKKLNTLSNGEGKRVQIAEALLSHPDVLILDNPFTGLDTQARSILNQFIKDQTGQGMTIILLADLKEIPDNISEFIHLKEGKIEGIYTRDEYKNLAGKISAHEVPDLEGLKEFLFEDEHWFNNFLEMRNVNVEIGSEKVLKNISWKVGKGEKWALTGPNGAGKSTLLSLVTGDNPQVYKNDISIFDIKSGEGQSIWEVKKRIGYVSPEFHIFFHRNLTFTESLTKASSGYGGPSVSCFEAVCSGFKDQTGSAQDVTSYQKRIALAWLNALNLGEMAKKCLSELSLGHQRLVLLARAMVKNPPVLILDEPCQGLDTGQTEMFRSVINELVKVSEKTIIYVSHYPEEIPDCIDRHLRLENGMVVSIS
jgi:molybdate transport system ATP-binding protein